MFLGSALVTVLDPDKDQTVTQAEFFGGFEQWFADWNADQDARLSDEELRAGIDRDLSPFRGGPPGGFGPPGG